MYVLLPGLTIAGAGTVVAIAAGQQLAWLSPLVFGVVIGVLFANVGSGPQRTAPGLAFAGKRLLRVGVVLLGLRLSVADFAQLGWRALIVVLATVFVTFLGTQRLGRMLGMDGDLPLLVATGYSICGASAIAAVEGATDADEAEVAAAVGLVTLAGTLAMVVVPLLGRVFGLDDSGYGAWTGASVHDVAQVVAAAAVRSPEALSTAIVVKLSRVALLAPLVLWVNLRRRRNRVADGGSAPLIPMFVAGFVIAIVVRSTGLLPHGALEVASTLEKVLFTAALIGLGAKVRIVRLRRLGMRPLLLGGLAWVLVSSVALAGVAVAF